MRGKALGSIGSAAADRITPAYAGKRILAGYQLRYMYGSPPPMRGKARSVCTYFHRLRITPAYAGKSLTGTVWTRPPRDHPRLCGEKSDQI